MRSAHVFWETIRADGGESYKQSGTGHYMRRVTTHACIQIVEYRHRIGGAGKVWKRGRGFRSRR